MPPREIRDFVSPLLQPPLNKLFVPRPTPDYLRPIDRDGHERKYVQVEPMANYLSVLAEPSKPYQPTDSIVERKDRLFEERRRQTQESLRGLIEKYQSQESETIVSDPFKTLFVGRLPYDVTESRLKREFERFGPIKNISIITNKTDGKARGYAFVEYERERDMKTAYVEADGTRFEGSQRRIVVDVERGRTVKGWLPRRLGGGLGKTRIGGKEQNQRHSGRDPRANDMLDELVKSGSHLPRKRSLSPSPRDHTSGSRYSGAGAGGARYADRMRDNGRRNGLGDHHDGRKRR